MPAREQQGGLAVWTILLGTIPQDCAGPVTLSADLQLTLRRPVLPGAHAHAAAHRERLACRLTGPGLGTARKPDLHRRLGRSEVD
jgi:hypothetical protein